MEENTTVKTTEKEICTPEENSFWKEIDGREEEIYQHILKNRKAKDEEAERFVSMPVEKIVLHNRLIQNHTVALDVHLDGKVDWDEIELFCNSWRPSHEMDEFREILNRNNITYRQRYAHRFVVEMKDLSKFIAITRAIHARATVILNIINGGSDIGTLADYYIMGNVESELRENGIECHTVECNPHDGSLFIDFSDINEAVKIIYGSDNIPSVEAELM